MRGPNVGSRTGESDWPDFASRKCGRRIAYNIELGMGGVSVPMEASAMDAPYRDAIAAVFDSVQPGLGWRPQFFSGEAGLCWWRNPSERRYSSSEQRSMSASAGLSRVR